MSILFIWIYTQKGGIKTIVWTDTLQTGLMIAAVFFSVYYLLKGLNISFLEFIGSSEFAKYSDVWVTDSLLSRNHFLKSFLGGAFVTICMTGLDQDMMQKNLSCRAIVYLMFLRSFQLFWETQTISANSLTSVILVKMTCPKNA